MSSVELIVLKNHVYLFNRHANFVNIFCNPIGI